MPSYYAAFFPDLSQHQWISDFRKKNDPKAKIVAPHITLINPTSKFSDTDLAKEIRRATGSTKKFSAVFRSAILMPESDQDGSPLFQGSCRVI
jgi:hypothetical protein